MAYSIDYLYRIQDRFSAVLNRMSQAATRFDAGVTRMQGKLGGLQQKFQATGARMANLQTGLASIGAGAFLKGALEESTAFQKSLNMTQAVTGSTTEQMDLMRNKALEWGAQTQFSSGQVAQAMAELGKMGNKTNDILDLMPGTMALAAAGEISMGEAANFSMGILNQFGMSLDQATNVADLMSTGASAAATSVTGLASAMANTGLDAKMAGLSIEDTTKALMAMASVNLEGAEAGTMMKAVLTEISIGGDKVREGFEKMGIDMDQYRDSTTGQIKDLWALTEAMKAGGANAAILGEMFGRQAKKGMGALLSADTAKLKEFDDAIEDSTGASRRMSETLMNGLEPMIQFQSIMQNLKVIVGSFVAEAITPLLSKFNIWMGNMQKNNPQMLKFITYFLMATTALGAILIPLGLFISAVGSVIGLVKTIIGLTKVWTAVQAAWNAVMALNPIAMIIIGIIALIAIIVLAVKHWDKIKAAAGMAWDWIKEKTMQAIEAVKGFIQGLWDKFSTLLDNPFFTTAALIFAPWLTIPALILKHWEPIKAFFIGLWEKLQPIIEGVGGFFRGVGDFFTQGSKGGASPYAARSPEAPSPGRMRGMSAEANASVSVYTEEGMGVKPFESSGNLGYNMVGALRRR